MVLASAGPTRPALRKLITSSNCVARVRGPREALTVTQDALSAGAVDALGPL